MKKVMFLTIFILFTCIRLNSTTKNIDGIIGLKFGMNKTECFKILKSKPFDISGERRKEMAIYMNEKLYNIDFKLYMWFHYDELYSCLFSKSFKTKKEQLNFFNNIIKKIAESYGKYKKWSDGSISWENKRNKNQISILMDTDYKHDINIFFTNTSVDNLIQ